MRTSRIQPALLILVFVVVACTPSISPTTNPTIVPTSDLTSLPDLTVMLIYLEMEGRQSNCVAAYTPYEIRVWVENIGLTDAGPFVVDLNGTHQQVDAGLTASQSIELHFPGTVPSGRYEAVVDVTDQVVELQEDNNSLSYIAPTPTPPPLCTASPTSTP